MPRSANAGVTSAVVVRDLGLLPYQEALALQRGARAALLAGSGLPTLFLGRHQPVLTLGQRGDRGGIVDEAAVARAGVPVVRCERGGRVTYHGPGQVVAYPVLDLRALRLDVHWYVERLEETVLRVLRHWGVEGFRDSGQRGVFTARGKIASVGVHVSRWATLHGLALNVLPDDHWSLIHPCGHADVTATSLAEHLQRPPPLAAVRDQVVAAFAAEFGVAVVAPLRGDSGFASPLR